MESNTRGMLSGHDSATAPRPPALETPDQHQSHPPTECHRPWQSYASWIPCLDDTYSVRLGESSKEPAPGPRGLIYAIPYYRNESMIAYELPADRGHIMVEIERVRETLAAATNRSKDEILTAIEDSYTGLHLDHAFLQSSTDQLIQKVQSLSQENATMHRLLLEKYSVRSLFIGAGSAFMGFVFSLLIWHAYNVVLVDPFLAAAGAVVSAGFAGLAAWRIKCHSIEF